MILVQPDIKEIQDQQVLVIQVQKVKQVQLVQLVLKEILERQVHAEKQVLKGTQVQLVQPDFKVIQVIQVKQVLLVQQV